jgi:hypothetical protein
MTKKHARFKELMVIFSMVPILTWFVMSGYYLSLTERLLCHGDDREFITWSNGNSYCSMINTDAGKSCKGPADCIGYCEIKESDLETSPKKGVCSRFTIQTNCIEGYSGYRELLGRSTLCPPRGF